MSKHTKGPWRVTDEYLDYLKNPTFGQAPEAIVGPNGEIVVASSEWLDLSEADARLIAAASELLELAVQYASECPECDGEGEILTEYGGDDMDIEPTFEPCDFCAKARAAIAKATGEPQS